MAGRFDPIHALWYPVVDDLVGGWAIALADKPLSQQDNETEGEIANFMLKDVAEHIANLHNWWYAGSKNGR